jgi:carbonic anhydrase
MKRRVAGFCLLAALLIGNVGNSADVKISPEQALQQLLDGNNRFMQNRAIHPDARPSAAPQHPIAVILSCSDSRVPPELAFDQGVSKLFVVRVAGNTYDRLALQSIEFAVTQLGTGLILVIGHDQCGAVRAAVKAYPDPHAGPMLENIYPAVRAAEHTSGDKVSAAIDANAELVAQRLEQEPALAAHLKAGDLTILPARYILATGKVVILKQ